MKGDARDGSEMKLNSQGQSACRQAIPSENILCNINKEAQVDQHIGRPAKIEKEAIVSSAITCKQQLISIDNGTGEAGLFRPIK